MQYNNNNNKCSPIPLQYTRLTNIGHNKCSPMPLQYKRIRIIGHFSFNIFGIEIWALFHCNYGVIPGISEDRGLRFLKYEDWRYDKLKYEEVKTQEYQINYDWGWGNLQHVIQFQLFWSMFEQTLYRYIAIGSLEILEILVSEHWEQSWGWE